MWRPLMMAAPACMAGRWHGCFDTFNGVLLMVLVGLPLAALVVWVLASLRRAGGVASAWRMSLAEVGMVYGTVPMVWLTLQPGTGAGVVPGRVSLIPLRDLVTMGPVGIGGNLLIFAALGFFAPMRFAWRPCRGSWCSGRAARSWSRPHSTSCAGQGVVRG